MQDEAGTPLTSTHRTDPRPAPANADGRSRLFVLLALTALCALAADQATKALALRSLTPGVPQPLIGEWIQLHLIRNSGAAFSLGSRATWVLTALSVVIIVVVSVNARRVASRPWAFTFGLLLGGAVGNLVDRVFREPGPFRGHVVDFIDYFGLFIGNVADIAIVVAAAVVVLLTWRGLPATLPRHQAEHE